MVYPRQDSVKDVMRKPAITADRNATIHDIILKMVNKSSNIVIITSNDRGVGIITERDIIRLIAKRKHLFNLSIEAEEVMSRPLITIEQDASLIDADVLMLQKNIRHLAVTTEADSDLILGQIDYSKIHDSLLTSFAKIAKSHKQYMKY